MVETSFRIQEKWNWIFTGQATELTDYSVNCPGVLRRGRLRAGNWGWRTSIMDRYCKTQLSLAGVVGLVLKYTIVTMELRLGGQHSIWGKRSGTHKKGCWASRLSASAVELTAYLLLNGAGVTNVVSRWFSR
jgi:hypothetical protein